MDGTTAIVCLLWRDPDRDASDSNVKLMVANCGDSRAVLVQRSEFDTHYEKCKRYHDESGSDVKLNSALAVLSAASTSRPNGLEEFLNNDDNLNSGSDDNEQQTNFPHSNHPSIRRIQKQLQKLCHDTPADTSVRSIVSGPISGVRLSEDHKPDREDERARIQERGGMVQDMTGCSRVFTPTPLQIGQKQVQWGLAVSRSFGDLPLKKPVAFNGPVHVTDLVSVMPEITTFEMKAGRDLALVRRTVRTIYCNSFAPNLGLLLNLVLMITSESEILESPICPPISSPIVPPPDPRLRRNLGRAFGPGCCCDHLRPHARGRRKDARVRPNIRRESGDS